LFSRKAQDFLRKAIEQWGLSPGTFWAVFAASLILAGALVQNCGGEESYPQPRPRRPLTLQEYFAPDGPASQQERDALLRDMIREQYQNGQLSPEQRRELQEALMREALQRKWQNGELTPEERQQLQDALYPRPTPSPLPTPNPTPLPTPRPSPDWIWPAYGRITSYFGPGHPLGIDIAINTGTPVLASAAGRVEYVGGNACCSYGYQVLVRHPSGWASRYAHFLSFAVSQGQWVEQGQVLGWSDNTGYSTGPHLHFEILTGNGVPVNPLVYLPATALPVEEQGWNFVWFILGVIGSSLVGYFLTIRHKARSN